MFASLSTNTGQIVWRRIQEDAKGLLLPSVADETALYTVSDAGRVIRVWNKRNGALLWQSSLVEKGDVRVSPSILLTAKSVVVLSSGKISSFSKKGEIQWTATVQDSQWSKMAISDGMVHHLSVVDGVLQIRDFALDTGAAGARRSGSTKISSPDKCVVAGNFLVCGLIDVLYVVDVTHGTVNELQKSVGFSIRSLTALENDNVLVKGAASATVFHLANDNIEQKLAITHEVHAATMSAGKLVTVAGKSIEVYDAGSYKQLFKAALPFDGNDDFAPTVDVYVSVKEAIELLVVGSDCRMEFVIVDPTKSVAVSEWVREEALARISAVEMVDLPLSELQQMIEDEFEEGGTSNIMSSFIRRLISQTSQIHKWLLNTVNEVFSLTYLISKRTNSFSKLLQHVRSTSRSDNHKGEVLERDFFNLRKIIVATSLDGVVYGLDSSDGAVVWRLWLGNNFEPLVSFTGKKEVPLFVQRTTAHYQLPGQASVAFKDSMSAVGTLVFFNPITGKVVDRTLLSFPISRVDVLSFVGQDHIYPLVVIGKKDEVSIHPPQPEDVLKAAPPIYILVTEGSRISGAKIDLLERKMVRTWMTDLQLTATESIISIKGKPRHQKTHSQGRVLIDRNVQYKYSNPNLVAIASLDSVHQYLSLFLVDVVSGQMVHSARLAKATAPVHLVNCEHWVAYSYWSEKGRRTEIGILELYEGSEQSSKNYFDSLTPTKNAPEIVTQSFIYAQGIQAMAVSETEKGLTTRSLLMALPLGGIHEVTRKLLDATRPLELTQEMREEMMIPYIPEIPIATEDMVNYNQTVHGVRGIKTAASGLESTSLMVAYGTDVFFTRLHPSGTFDILKDDFDHVLISIVLFGLIAGSVVSKKLARNNALSAAWA